MSLQGDPRPMVLGLATIRSDREPRVLRDFEDYCRRHITDQLAPGMRIRDVHGAE